MRTILCDRPECYSFAEFGATAADADLTVELARRGWTTVPSTTGGLAKNYCPVHSGFPTPKCGRTAPTNAPALNAERPTDRE